MIERWMQHFDKHLTSAKNVSTKDQGNEGNNYDSGTEGGNEHII